MTNQMHKPLLISILSGKGGVGKSVIAFNLSSILSQQNRRVLLVDADFTNGNQHILSKCTPKFGVQDFLTGTRSLHQCVTTLTPTLDLLGSKLNSAAVEGYSVTQAAQFTQNLHKQAADYDVVIIDHASGISNPATVIAHGSHINVLVIVPELTSIADGYGLFKYLNDANQSIDCRLFINRVRSTEEPDSIYAKFKTLTEKYLTTAPRFGGGMLEADELPESVAAQRPVVQIARQSHVVQSLMRLGKLLAGSPETNRLADLTHENTDNYKTAAVADLRM